MAFTVSFDNSTEEKLKELMAAVNIKTKTEALKYLVHRHDSFIDQQNTIIKLEAQIDILSNQEFIQKLSHLLAQSISGRLTRSIVKEFSVNSIQ
jgi:hypothetical protein